MAASGRGLGQERELKGLRTKPEGRKRGGGTNVSNSVLAPSGLRETPARPLATTRLSPPKWDSHIAGSRTDLTPGTKAAAGLGRAGRRGKHRPLLGPRPQLLTMLTLWIMLVFSESWPKYLSLDTSLLSWQGGDLYLCCNDLVTEVGKKVELGQTVDIGYHGAQDRRQRTCCDF